MKLDALATMRHYHDHIASVWEALPPEIRGTFGGSRRGERRPTIVAGWKDLNGLSQAIYMEHGSGQSYGGRHPAYAGGRGRERVGLFLCPSQRVVEANREYYPDATYAVIGCPKMDTWAGFRKPPSERPTVALSFHWDCGLVPETRSAWAHFLPAFRELTNQGWRVLGHSHPRAMARRRFVYQEFGIEVVTDFADVLARADVYAVDNSSTLFEFAATGRPVVVLNAPWYRREVSHGHRFWEYADVGVQADEPGDLVPAIERALLDTSEQRRRRAEVTGQVYGVPLGQASQTAAGAITEWVTSREMRDAA